MAMASEGMILRQLRRLFTHGTVAGLTEGQLLERFVTKRDEAAFEALIARHGPMVLGVCRRVLSDPHDVEDAFQATFLILVRKAAGLRNRELVGNWLYGVAYRVAVRSRQTAARRFLRERPGDGEHAVEPNCEPLPDDVRPLLLEEVSRLPEKYRAPVVLCYFEGQTHEEAAAHLRWPLGTVKGRLARAREELRSRLLKRGVASAPAGLLLVDLADSASAAVVVPASLLESTLKAAMVVAAGNSVAGAVSASAAALFEGVLKTMFISKLKIVSVAAVSAGMLASGAGLWAYQFGGGSGAGGLNQSSGRARVAAAGGSGAGAAAAPSSKRLEVAQEALRAVEKMTQAGELADVTQLAVWSRRLSEAQSEMSEDEAGKIAALEAHVDRMKRYEARAKAMVESGQMSSLGFLEAQFLRAEAEDELAQTHGGMVSGMMGSGGGMAMGGGMPGGRMGVPGVGGGMGGAAGPPRGEQGGVGQGMIGGMGGLGMNPFMAGQMGVPGMGGGGLGMAGAPRGYGMAGPPRGRIFSLEESRKDARNQRILEKLELPIPMAFPDETPLRDVIAYIKSATADEKNEQDDGIPIYLDPKEMSGGEVTFDSPVTIDLKGIPLKTTLRLVLSQLDMAYAVKEGILLIGDRHSEELQAPPAQAK